MITGSALTISHEAFNKCNLNDTEITIKQKLQYTREYNHRTTLTQLT